MRPLARAARLARASKASPHRGRPEVERPHLAARELQLRVNEELRTSRDPVSGAPIPVQPTEEQAPGLLFSRIGALQLETRTKQCAPLYAGQETCDEALAFMTSLGYRSNHACPKQPRWCERTMKFFRPSEGNFSAARGAIGGHREFYS